MRHEIAMIRARVVPGKHGMVALMLEIKEVEIKAEAIPVYMHQGNTETQHLKDNNETTTVMVHVDQINKNITLPLPTEEERRQPTSEDHDLEYI